MAGIRTLQNPNDVWIIQEITIDVKPDLIIETGTLNGGSAILWAMILREINSEGRVITIDVQDQTTEARKNRTFQEGLNSYWAVQLIRKLSPTSASVLKIKKFW